MDPSALPADETLGCCGCTDKTCPVSGLAPNPPLSGWRMAAAATGVFLVPLALALIGAGCGGKSATGQLLGALTGLAAGMTTLGILVRWLGPKQEAA